MYLPILFNGSPLSQLPVYPTLGIDWQLMGAKEIKADIELPGAINCPIGSYISYKGEKFTVNTVPSVTAGNTYDFKYTITFESELYRLYDKKLKHLKNKTFQYYGSPADYAQLIVDNINEIDTEWSVGDCESATEKTIDFDGHTCRTALDTIAEAFNFEWAVVGKVITFVKQVGNTTAYVFERGRGKGLYSLGYEYQNDKNIVTRAFGYGSTRNLPANYRGGATQLMFAEEYLDNNTSLYRIKEGDYVNEDIYPKVDGLVTGVSTFNADADFFTVTDTTLNFNLKDHFSTDTPKISFLTGELQGQEFEILDFENATKTIKVKVFTDGSNNKQPNSVFQAAIGDTYTLFDMFLPAESVAAAEALLKAKTQEWLLENSVPRVLYSLEMDPLYARDNGIMLKPGDKVRVIDGQLGIDSMVRVTGVSYPINFPEVITPDTKINVQIANFIPYTTTERVISDTIDTKQEVKYVNRINAERARRNSASLRTLQSLIFNPDGTLFDGPNSIVAGMAAFGFDSQNFNLDNVTIIPNPGGDANAFTITAGRLVHYVYKIDGLGYIWDMAGRSWSGLDPIKNYYLYAKCSNGVLTGTWELSETPVLVNDIPGYYAFNLGILYKVNSDGYRVLQSTKGVTTIVGDQITTGTISSIDGTTSFNLNTGVIKGRIQFENGSSGYNNLSDKPDLSGLAATSYVNAIKDSLQNQIDGQITNWFYDYEPSMSNAPATEWTTDAVKDIHLGDLFYWTSKGYAYRFAKDTGTGVFSWMQISDVDVVLALQKASLAQDTADSKRRVFTTTPVTPYDVGDLWAGGSNADIKRCIVPRLTGDYVPADWELASKYTDDTVANTALANSENALETAEAAAAVTNGLFTVIDGNVVTTGTLQAGDATHINAGLTGVTDQGSDSVRFWAGVPYANRYTAPFRVTDKGSVTLQSSNTGKRIVIDGDLNNLKFIDTDGSTVVRMDSAVAIEGYQDLDPPNPPVPVYGPGIMIGSYGVANDYTSLGRQGVDTSGFVKSASVSSGDIKSSGDVTAGDDLKGNIVVANTLFRAGTSSGESFIQVYKGANGDNYFIEFKGGIAVRHGSGTG
jgi:hypothetical protein